MKHILKENEVSWFSWLPCIWLILSASRIANWDLQKIVEERSIEVESNPVMQVALTLLILLGLYCLSKRKLEWGKIFRANIWLVLFFLYMGLSIFWSEYPFVSLKRYIKGIGIIIMVLVICTEDYPQQALSGILKKVFIFILLISTVLIFFVPSQGLITTSTGELSWVGFTYSKNNLGQLACFSSIYFFWIIREQRVTKTLITNILFLLLSIFLLFGSRSMTSILLFILAFSLLMFYRIQLQRRYVIIAFLYCIIFFGLIIVFFDQVVFQEELIKSLFGLAGRDVTFTGRTDLWKDVLSLASHNLWLGVGYGAFWIGKRASTLSDIYLWIPNQAHNGYIDVIANIGIVGLILMICTTISAIVNISSQFYRNYDLAKIRMVLLIIILVYNLTESSLCRDANFLWFLYLLAVFNSNYDNIRREYQ